MVAARLPGGLNGYCMEIGKLRHRLELQSFVETADEYGQEIKAYSTFDTVWGRVTPLTGRELLEAQQLNSRIDHKVTIRHQPLVKPINRILHKTRILEAVSVLDADERRIQMKILCIESIVPVKEDP